MARLRISKDEHRDIAAALRALRAAQRVATNSSVARSVVRNGELVRISPDGKIQVLRELPPRRVIVQRRVSLKGDAGAEKKLAQGRILMKTQERISEAKTKLSRIKKDTKKTAVKKFDA